MQGQQYGRLSPQDDMISSHPLDGDAEYESRPSRFAPKPTESFRPATKASADAFLRLPPEVILRSVTPS